MMTVVNVAVKIILQDLLVIVFENGSLVREYSFEEIRERAELPLVKKRRQESSTFQRLLDEDT